MAKIDLNETIQMPEGVSATIDGKNVTIKGAKGELTRRFQIAGLVITIKDGKLGLEMSQATQRQKNLLFTSKAHLKNMMQGVNEGFNYKLKICSGHFPMNVTTKGNKFEIKNFIGEKVPRQLTIKEGAEVKINGDEIEVNATDKEVAGQVAADIEKMTRRSGFDKRIFQDGIYITEKAGKTL